MGCICCTNHSGNENTQPQRWFWQSLFSVGLQERKRFGDCGLGLVSLLQIPESFVKQCSNPDQMCQFIPYGGADPKPETLMMHQYILWYHLDAEILVREGPGLGIGQ